LCNRRKSDRLLEVELANDALTGLEYDLSMKHPNSVGFGIVIIEFDSVLAFCEIEKSVRCEIWRELAIYANLAAEREAANLEPGAHVEMIVGTKR